MQTSMQDFVTMLPHATIELAMIVLLVYINTLLYHQHNMFTIQKKKTAIASHQTMLTHDCHNSNTQ